MPMSTQNESGDGDHPQEPGHSTSPVSGGFHPTHSPHYQHSFPQQPFASPPYYPARHSASPQEQRYAGPAPYIQQPGPGSGFIGQFMAPQPSHPMTLQSSTQFGYSHSFGHSGTHPETGPLAMQYNPHHSNDYAYQNSAAPTSEAHAGDRGSMPPQGYAGPPSFTDAAGATQQPGPAPSSSSPHMPHHGYTSVPFPRTSTSPHYTGYPAPSFSHSAHSSPALYSFVPPPGAYPHSFYGQHPTSPEEASKRGPWWYMPPGGAQHYDPSAYQSGYQMARYQPPMQMARPEFDPYASQGQVSPPPFVGPSNQHIRLSPGATPARDRPPQPSPAATRPSSDVPRADAASPVSKRRSPQEAASASPPAASRKSYHPNPPPNRSEWVMWVGNVPSDATHDELWRFFNQPAPSPAASAGASAVLSSRQVRGEDSGDLWGGVASVFLISRSNCAFVNFDTEQHLARAVAHFNGKPVRPRDPRCPRLVCRVRRKDDDLKAGVGGQRGMGLHTRWVAEQKERGRERERARQKEREQGASESGGEGSGDTESSGDGPPTSPSTYLAPSSSSDPSPPIPAVSSLVDPGPVTALPESHQSPGTGEARQGSLGNQSFTSTNSSFLASNFPKRYFILKSLTQFDLNLSVDRGIWATQSHNEGILDQAFRTSTDVFLIFGVNKSGEFFGYARMAGPIFHGERVDRVSWASRSSGQGSVSGIRSGPDAIHEEEESGNFLSPSEKRMVYESPAPVTPGEDSRLHRLAISKPRPAATIEPDPLTAPAEFGERRKPIVTPNQEKMQGPNLAVQPKAMTGDFVLRLQSPDDLAKARAQKDPSAKTAVGFGGGGGGVMRNEKLANLQALRRLQEEQAARAAKAEVPAVTAELPTPPQEEPKTPDETRVAEDKPEGWGREFKVEWLRRERLPFHRTRHLRNPWNHDREVKVSRDGTELEPGVGQRLLDEWDKRLAEVDASPPTSPASRVKRPLLRPASGTGSGPTTSTPPLSMESHRISPTGQGQGQGRGRGRSPPQA